MAKVTRPYVNTALFTVTNTTTGTVQPFAPVNVDRYKKLKDAKAPTRARIRIDRVYLKAEPGSETTVAKALKGAVVALVGQTGKRIELGPAALLCADLMKYDSDEPFNLTASVVVPEGAPYDVLIEYQEGNALADKEQCNVFVKVEGVEIEEV